MEQGDLAARLHGFKIRNVRSDEQVSIGTKRMSAQEVMTPLAGNFLLACTDERRITELIDPQTGKQLNLSDYLPVRAAGAAFGVVDAVRNVRVTINRTEILNVLRENGVTPANHIDTHAKEGALTGCGQALLRSLPESGSVFDRSAVPVSERMRSFEEQGVYRMVLEGDHTAEGFFVNPLSDRVLKPDSEAAKQSFYSLDLGIYRDIIRWIGGALSFGDEVATSILVKLTRNNLAAVFILSGGAINEAVYVERNDNQDAVYSGILHEAMAELKERTKAIVSMIESRSKG